MSEWHIFGYQKLHENRNSAELRVDPIILDNINTNECRNKL